MSICITCSSCVYSGNILAYNLIKRIAIKFLGIGNLFFNNYENEMKREEEKSKVKLPVENGEEEEAKESIHCPS